MFCWDSYCCCLGSDAFVCAGNRPSLAGCMFVYGSYSLSISFVQRAQFGSLACRVASNQRTVLCMGNGPSDCRPTRTSCHGQSYMCSGMFDLSSTHAIVALALPLPRSASDRCRSGSFTPNQPASISPSQPSTPPPHTHMLSHTFGMNWTLALV